MKKRRKEERGRAGKRKGASSRSAAATSGDRALHESETKFRSLEALRESEKRFRSLYSMMSEGVCLHEIVYDEHGAAVDYRIIDVNPAFESIIGLTRERAVGSLASEIYGTGEPPYLDIYAQVASTGKPTTFDTYFAPMKKHFSISVFSPGKGKFATVFADITERKRVEDALQTRERQLSSIYSNASDVLFLLSVEPDDRFRFLSINQSFLDATGLRENQIVGRDVREVIPEPSLTLVLENYRQAIRDNKTVRWEEVTEYPEGRKCGDVSVTPILDANGHCTNLVGTVHDITERKNAEEALCRSEERYRIINQNMSEGVWLMDMNLKPTYISPSVTRARGYTLEELYALPLDKQVTPDSLKLALKTLQEVLPDVNSKQTDRPLTRTLELEFYRKDGSTFWSENTFTLLMNSDNEPAGILAVSRDITERRRMEEEIRSLALFPSENPNPILRLDRHGTVISANEASKALLQEWSSGIGEVAPKSWRDLVTDALSTGESRNMDVEFGGKAYTFLVKPLMEAEYVNLYGGEITERKRAEDALRESENRLRRITDNMLDMVVEADLQGVCKYASQSHKAVLGYDPEDLVGKSLFDFIHPEDLGTVTETIQRAVSTGRLWTGGRFECRYRHADGHYVWLENLANILRDEKGQMIGSVIASRDLTDRKRMEDELGKLSQFRESIIDNANVWLDVLDENANIVVWNKAAEVISGYSREEVIGHGKIWEWLYPDEEYRKSITDSVTEVLRSGRVDEDFETRIRRKDGHIRIISWNERNLLDEQGKVTGSIAIGEDVTERKRMQEELHRYSAQLEGMVAERTGKLTESERRFRELADLLPQIVFETDETGKVTFGNQAGFAITGYAQEDLDRGFNALQLFVPEERARVRDRIMRTLGGERSSGTEYRAQRKDGSTFPVIIFTAAALREGKAVGLRGIAIDITDRKRAEDELRAAKEQLDYVVTSNPAVIFTGKPRPDLSNFDATYLSKSVVSLLGFEPEDYIEMWYDRVHPEDVRRYLAEVPLLWKDGKHVFEYRFLHKDGTYRWIREEAKVVRDAAGNPAEVVGYWTDVTDRKRLEAELAKSQRLAAIGETTAMIGHDLRNPLQGIVSTIYLAKRNLESPPEPSSEAAVNPGLVDMLETIEKESQYMDKIVSDLQDYAAPFKTEPKPVEMEPLVKDTLSKIRIPQNVKVSFKVSEPLPPVMVDPAVMRRVFTNLITNAIQAMPDGGELRIDVYGTDESLLVAFKDTGVGIPEENVGKLFNPFFTTKAKGQGLGLAVCKRLVEAHNGRITLESKLGEGSTFTVKLPIIKP